MTIKEIVDTIPARLGLEAGQIDLSTPEKAYDFLTDSDFQIFAQSSGSDHIFDSAPGNYIILETGYKAMYDVNNLFAETSTKREVLQKKYGASGLWVADMCVDDEDGYVDFGSWAEENLHVVSDNNWPYKIGFNEFGKFNEFIETIRKICIANDEWAKVTAFISDEEYSLDIHADGTVVHNESYAINDDNGHSFAYTLANLLEVYVCDSFEELENVIPAIIINDCEDKTVIDTECGLMYEYFHKEEIANLHNIEEAVELVKKYPRILRKLPEEIQKNKLVAQAFIEANEAYVIADVEIFENSRYGRHAFLTGPLSRGRAAHLKLNGIIDVHGILQDDNYIKDDIIRAWCRDPELFDKLMASSMYRWIVLDDELMNNIDNKNVLTLYPQYVYILRDYFEKKVREDSKLAEHIKRKFGLLNDIKDHSVAVMAVYEIILDVDPKLIAKLVDSYDSFILAPYIAELLLTVPKTMRDDIIKTNIKMAYYISDELENDEEIVDYICEYCPKAGDILSDEIVIKRNLKRTTLNPDDICEDCDLC